MPNLRSLEHKLRRLETKRARLGKAIAALHRKLALKRKQACADSLSLAARYNPTRDGTRGTQGHGKPC